MKAKFIFLTFLLLFTRGCDFYSTSLWFFQPNGHLGETNPLTSIFGFGWTGLVVSNIILVGLIIYAFYFYSFRYLPKRLPTVPQKLTDFVSELYFDEKGHFYSAFYKTPKNKKILLAHWGYVLIRVVIFGSILATIHNLCQFYNVPIYNSYREIVGRPLFVIYGLIVSSIFYFQFRIWNREFELAKKQSGHTY